VKDILAREAAGRGLNVPEMRRLYPARDVRRTSVLEAVRFLEDCGVVTWNGPRVRWIGPLPTEARVLGVRARRLERDLALAPDERVAAAAALSEAFAWKRAEAGA
jgi:hypothetical protein